MDNYILKIKIAVKKFSRQFFPQDTGRSLPRTRPSPPATSGGVVIGRAHRFALEAKRKRRHYGDGHLVQCFF